MSCLGHEVLDGCKYRNIFPNRKTFAAAISAENARTKNSPPHKSGREFRTMQNAGGAKPAHGRMKLP